MSAEKATVEQIRERFDHDVERFSNLETGQSSTVDAPIAMDLVCSAAAVCTPRATHLLDLGCGAGNYSLKLLEHLPTLNVTLVDLSQPMLDRAQERVTRQTTGVVKTIQSDLRELKLEDHSCDIVLASAVLHHLRTDEEWSAVFEKIYQSLRPGGSFWIFDLVLSSSHEIHELMWQRYGEYLTGLKDDAYRQHVFDYIEYEDTPRPLMEQLELLKQVGFAEVELLHKNSCFAAFGGIKR
ncbi:methyltransferase domain-containing protein [Rubinisphaera sp.]|uniref:class I SAM-dependent methyltransferase n=1 Tax=Rubinisphaera sp. TaxID=2024857 RepID=UPI000C0CFD75|nr:methyltransferase domain-containing protein [Rubinisphaera sp.]MBV08579.1 SAM-dependent methyltransferase [Rubinisphaera sp.]HCS55444.1 class I SAM-dependent methyltransferase [Planctomycetaceae bacterium]|tara:strand:- start:2572 stop:3288 length:717 start_codon:yes stop_codon:yes gene_type:complete